jgi:hypothetical protein
VELSDLKLDESEIEALTQIDKSSAAIAILTVAKRLHDRELSRIREGLVCISDTDPKKDFRYSIGAASMAARLISLQREAIAFVNEQNNNSRR